MGWLSRNTLSRSFSARNARILISLALLLVACIPVSETSPENFQQHEGSKEPEPAESGTETPTSIDRDSRPTMKIPERLPTRWGTPLPPITGEAPAELLNAIKSDLSALTGVATDEILVIRDQATVWSDGSLGCPQPGILYTQALVNGYWVVLQVGEEEYDYRAAESGYFFRCESGGFSPISPPGDGSDPGLTPDK